MDTQESNQPTEEAEDKPDRREMLAQALEDSEGTQEQPQEIQDAKPAQTVQADPEAAAEPEEKPVWERPPSSWKRDYHEIWETADPKLKQYAYQREEEMRAGIEPLIPKAKFADEVNRAVEPYLPIMKGLGVDVPQAVKGLMDADYKLRTLPADQKRAYLGQLASAYGINLADGEYTPQAAPVDPMVYQLQNELNSIRGEVVGWKQQQEAVEQAKLEAEINKFSQKAEFFEDARPVMIQLLNSGVSTTLEDAYDKALRLDNSLFERIQQGQQAKAEADKRAAANQAAKVAKAAAVGIKSSTPGTRTATKAQDRRSLLLEQLDSVSERF
jgi:hypothetical protein